MATITYMIFAHVVPGINNVLAPQVYILETTIRLVIDFVKRLDGFWLVAKDLVKAAHEKADQDSAVP